MNLSSSPVETTSANRSTVSFSRYARGILSRPLTANVPAATPDRAGTELLSSSLGAARTQIDHVAASDGQRTPTTPGAPSARLSYECDAPLNAFAASSGGAHVAVAGRESLKVLEVGYHEVRDVCDLTAASDRHSSTNDVKWGIGPTSNLIATAHSNGTVTTWNVDKQRAGRQASISGHGRAINRVAFNPGNGSWLLTASQDGNMRLWDLRERNGSARFSLVGRAEAVRDVQFNAANALELAAVFDSGVLQRWDLRRPNSFEAKVNAHNGPALSVDWHADGVHLATGGRDKVIKIWNARGDLKRPVHYICTMAPVARAVWRAGDARHHWDIASCSLTADTAINVWSLRRPHLPIRTIEQHEAAVTGLLWRNDETLWSCSKDRSFRQHPVGLALCPADSVTHVATAWHPTGELALSVGSVHSDRYRERQAARGLLLSRAGSDVSLEGRRSRESLVDAAPLAQGAMHFDPLALPFKPVQTQATVEPLDLSDDIFRFMAMHYMVDKEDPAAACEHNALVATECGRHQTAKCWRMLLLALVQAQRRLDDARRIANDPPVHKLVESLRDKLEASHATLRASSPATSLIMPRYTDRQASDSPTFAQRKDSASSASGSGSGSNTGSEEEVSTQHDASSDAGQGTSGLRRSSLATDVETLSRISSHDASMSSADDSNPYGSYYGVSALEDIVPDQVQRPRTLLSDVLESGTGGDVTPVANTMDGGSVATLQPPALAPAEDIDRTGSLRDRAEVAADELAAAKAALVQAVADDDRPWTLAPLLAKSFRHYRDQADAQTAVTITLVFDDFLPDAPAAAGTPPRRASLAAVTAAASNAKPSVSARDLDEVLFAYVDLLHRRRLFVTAAEVVRRARHDAKIVAAHQADAVVQLTCQRCMKAAPFTGVRKIPVRQDGADSPTPLAPASALASSRHRDTVDEAWHCSRCQNTVLCTICETTVSGECAHCPSCGHSAHLKCAARWRASVVQALAKGGHAAETVRRCVVPSCDCECV